MSRSFVLLLIVLETVQSKLACNLDVSKCMTMGAQNIYDALVVGVEDLIEPIDPLHLETVDANFPGFKYHVTNATMNGLRNCTVELLKTDERDYNFELDLHCPKLIFTYQYAAKGTIFSYMYLDGQGFAYVVIDDYYIKIKGTFKRFISLKDQKPNISIVSHFIETDLKGKLTVKTDEQINPDKAKSDAYKAVINEDYKDTEVLLRSPLLEDFMTLFVERFNTYMANYSFEELFPQEEKKRLVNFRGVLLA